MIQVGHRQPKTQPPTHPLMHSLTHSLRRPHHTPSRARAGERSRRSAHARASGAIPQGGAGHPRPPGRGSRPRLAGRSRWRDAQQRPKPSPNQPKKSPPACLSSTSAHLSSHATCSSSLSSPQHSVCFVAQIPIWITIWRIWTRRRLVRVLSQPHDLATTVQPLPILCSHPAPP